MAYRATYKSETDCKVKNMIPKAPSYITVNALLLCDRRLRKGTVRNSLTRLFKAGAIQRAWIDGKDGHYGYSIPIANGT